MYEVMYFEWLLSTFFNAIDYWLNISYPIYSYFSWLQTVVIMSVLQYESVRQAASQWRFLKPVSSFSVM